MKRTISITTGTIAATGLVAADLISPGDLLIGAGALVLLFGGFVVGAVFLIRWIIKKNKKPTDKPQEQQVKP